MAGGTGESMSVSEPWRGLHDLGWGQEMKGASLGEGRTTWAGVGEDCRQGRRDCDKKKKTRYDGWHGYNENANK